MNCSRETFPKNCETVFNEHWFYFVFYLRKNWITGEWVTMMQFTFSAKLCSAEQCGLGISLISLLFSTSFSTKGLLTLIFELCVERIFCFIVVHHIERWSFRKHFISCGIINRAVQSPIIFSSSTDSSRFTYNVAFYIFWTEFILVCAYSNEEYASCFQTALSRIQ